MGLLVLVAFISLACKFGSDATIEHERPKQELFEWQQKLAILSKRLHSECTNYIDKHVIDPVDIDVAKKLYSKLVDNYAKCQKEKSQKLVTSTATTRTSTTATTATLAPIYMYKDCQEYYERGYRKSGVYMIKLSNGNLPGLNVWCDFINNHGWTVIQRRGNQSLSFNRNWNAYKSGFGDIDGEHWMGNEIIHFLTQTNQKLNVLVISKSDGERSGIWKKFTVTSESDKYRLTIDGGGYTGDLVDKFSSIHNGMAFSTSDRDNDNYAYNCAEQYRGGWWYNNCHYVDLNNGLGDGMGWWVLSRPFSLSVMRVTRD